MAEYPYTASGSFRVRPHRPGRTIVVTVFLVVGMVSGGWWLYELGLRHGGADARMARATEARLRLQLDDLRTRVSELVDERTLLERSRRIDETTFQRLEEQLEQREQHIGHLEEELAFYRSLVSPANGDSGMNIERVSLFREGGNEYRYEIVLTRLDHDDTEVTGNVDLAIEGSHDAEDVRLELSDLLVDENVVTDFRFKYFQALSGRIRLPEGVHPVAVHVTIQPDDDSIERVAEEFAWDSLVSGGA